MGSSIKAWMPADKEGCTEWEVSFKGVDIGRVRSQRFCDTPGGKAAPWHFEWLAQSTIAGSGGYIGPPAPSGSYTLSTGSATALRCPSRAQAIDILAVFSGL